ncbi:RusA family crossover junction endodeoxyribonuclease [Streptomyces acidiscabies]|uniref:RusA family crossover junction endodeoxyribonuclease n=1 Tax=Streptomyces acidiscabies TaxID=42234 RepID=A0AAP6BL74_9ACTN|nr:RusA family crossover junction endodeoxyribonuclease [Streptomyces acidiscabies]MDX2966623.1 RusA family crossover junction endodeoxyribonuclease [Streptomyces acidiscabies]MDX3796593.1 RusA family crossover junction endodeoxyribonuclease [Streptomyces acidiscabies]
MTTLFDPEASAAITAAGPRPAPGLSITVYGLPAPQGSKRHVGNGVMIESSKKVKPWRQDVKQAALDAIAGLDGWTPLDGPLVASMVFTFARPKGHYRTGRNAHLLRDSAPARPSVTPDLSKILRSTEDALTGVVWADDARVVGYSQLGKWYAGTDAVDVLTMPGCVIRVWPLGEAVPR